MEEKELIAKIRELRQIKPNQEWVSLTKSQILGSSAQFSKKFVAGEESQRRQILIFNFPILRPVYAGLIVVFALFGLLGFSQNSLPGDLLYPIKKIVERGQEIFVSEEELPKVQLELANKRLEELNKIAETNQTQKLAPAIKEVQASVSQATKNLVKSEKADKETVVKVVNLKKNLEKAETVLTTKISNEEDEQNIENWTKEKTEMLIKDLENRTLTEKQKEIFAEAKKDFETGNYSGALIKLLELSQGQ